MKKEWCDSMQTNAMLRRRTFQLFWQNRGMLWRISFLFASVNLLWYAVKTYLIGNDLPEIIYQLVTIPVMILGFYHLLLHLTKGKDARWSMLFDFVKSPKLLPKVLAVGLIWQIPAFIVHFSSLFGMPTIHQQELAIFVLVVTIVIVLLISWIELRLFLVPYLFVTSPQESVPEMMKSSFRMMKGQVRHLLWYGITVYWWGFALLIVALLVFPSLSLTNTSVSGQLIRQVVLPLIMALINPYFSLSLAGFASRLLPSAKQEKRAWRKEMRAERNA